MSEKYQLTHAAQFACLQYLRTNGRKVNWIELAAKFCEVADPKAYLVLQENQGEHANFTEFLTGLSPESVYNFIVYRQPKSEEMFKAGCAVFGLNPDEARAKPRKQALLQQIKRQTTVQAVFAINRLLKPGQTFSEISPVLEVDLETGTTIKVDVPAIAVEQSLDAERFSRSKDIQEFTVEATLPNGGVAVPLGYVFLHVKSSAIEVLLNQLPSTFTGADIRCGKRSVGLIQLSGSPLLHVVLTHLSNRIGQKPSQVSMVLLGEDLFEFKTAYRSQPMQPSEHHRIAQALALTNVGRSLTGFGYSKMSFQVCGRLSDGTPQFIYLENAHVPQATAKAFAA